MPPGSRVLIITVAKFVGVLVGRTGLAARCELGVTRRRESGGGALSGDDRYGIGPLRWVGGRSEPGAVRRWCRGHGRPAPAR